MNIGRCLRGSAVLVVWLFSSSLSMAQNGRNELSIDQDGKPIIGFAVQQSRAADKLKPFDLVVYYKGKQLAREHSANDPLADESGGRLINVPQTGCETLVAQTFSGGAHCCTQVFLGTRCGHKDYIIKADGGDRDPVEFDFLKDLDGDGVQELALTNRAFSYYQPDDVHFIPGAFFQGGLLHYAIWTPQGWRFSRPGELTGFYKEQLARFLRARGRSRSERDDAASAAAAIGAAYYALMAGEADAQARKLLVRELPPDWKPIAGKVFADIKKGIALLSRQGALTAIVFPPSIGGPSPRVSLDSDLNRPIQEMPETEEERLARTGEDKFAGTSLLICEGKLRLQVDAYLSKDDGLYSKKVVHFPDSHIEVLDDISEGAKSVSAKNGNCDLSYYRSDIALSCKKPRTGKERKLKCSDTRFKGI